MQLDFSNAESIISQGKITIANGSDLYNYLFPFIQMSEQDFPPVRLKLNDILPTDLEISGFKDKLKEIAGNANNGLTEGHREGFRQLIAKMNLPY